MVDSLLSLDLGNKTGFCVLHNHKLESGLLKMTPKKIKSEDKKYYLADCYRFNLFYNWLEEQNDKYQFNHIYFEEVETLHLSIRASAVYFGFRAMLLAFAKRHDIHIVGVSVGTIKKFATGKGNADKEAMIDVSSMEGFLTKDDNIADAYQIMGYALANLEK